MHVFCIFVFAPVQRNGACFHMERRSRNALIIIIIIIMMMMIIIIIIIIIIILLIIISKCVCST